MDRTVPDRIDGEAIVSTTGGYSQCHLAGNAPRIVNDNDECSRECTQAHEEFHVRDWGACCEETRGEYHEADAAEKNRVMRAWNEWIDTNRAYFECRAYPVSIACARRLHRSNDCDEADTECCDQIGSYLRWMRNRRDHYCGDDGSDRRTRCPFPPLGASALLSEGGPRLA